MAYSIYVTEDDEGIREMIQIALENFSYEVTAFENAEDALEASEKKAPDLFIFDIMLPGMDGIKAVKELRRRSKTAHTPTLFLTAKDTEMDKVIGLDAGGDDYLAKPFGVMELAARVRALLRRSSKENVKFLIADDLSVNLSTREVTISGKQVELTFKEFELLTLLMKNSERVLPREELLESIWGSDFIGEPRTLDTHIKSLRQKLGDSTDSPKYILTVRNVGYRFREA